MQNANSFNPAGVSAKELSNKMTNSNGMDDFAMELSGRKRQEYE